MRHALSTVLVLQVLCCGAQGLANDSSAALTLGSTISLPRNHAQVLHRAREAWQYTFGREPGAQLSALDTVAMTMEGSAYIRFRSEMLVSREQTMGIIAYKVKVQARNGECRTRITELRHVGNHNAVRGAIDVGLLTNNNVPPRKVRGMGRGNATQLWKELKTLSQEHLEALLRRYEAVLRRDP